MAFEVDSVAAAATFISANLADEAGIGIITDLLRIAGGRPASENRYLTATQFSLLEGHRVLSLVPSEWTSAVPDKERQRVQHVLAITRLKLWAVSDEIQKLLATENIESRVLKGLATARLDYPKPEMRDTGDVDLLVRSDQLTRVVDLLLANSCRYHSPVHGDLDLGKGITLVHPMGAQIDLHTRLSLYARQDCNLLMANPQPIEGTSGFAMPLELRLLHAASHLVYSPPGTRRLSGVADISAILDRNEIDWNGVRRAASDLGIERSAGLGLHVEAVLRGRNRDDLKDWEGPNLLERLSFARTKRALLMEKVLAFSALEGFNARSRYVRQWTAPNRESLKARGGLVAYYRKMIPRRFGGQGAKSDIERRGL
jgi:hypothetical protein